MELNEAEQELISDVQLLTSKPILYVCNVDEGSVVDGNRYVDKVKDAVADEMLKYWLSEQQLKRILALWIIMMTENFFWTI